MKNIIIGFIIGLLLGGSLAWAATEFFLVSQNGTPVGTTANPLIVVAQ